jgi:hypothetical protein
MASKASKPHLTKLLRHNNLPSEPELQEAFELRSKSQEDLLQVDTKIQRLRKKRAGIQKSIDKCNTILSPARRLLPDVLREIFYHCLPDDRNPTLSATEAPVLLTRVCSIWRAVALTSPLIWARLHISLPGNPCLSPGFESRLSSAAIAKRYQVFSKAMELRCLAVKDWLTRAGTCPLSISLSYPMGLIEAADDSVDDREAYDVTEPLFQQILPFSQRWKHVELSMPFSIYKKLETLISGDALPLLNSLRGNMSLDDIGFEHPDSDPVPVRFLEAPNLQRLSLNSRQLSQKIIMFPPIWGQLIDLRIQSTITDVDFFNIIKLCHNLVTCQVDNMQVPWSSPYVPQTEVVIPTLQMIRINELGGASHVVQAINAPNLKSLDYRFPARFCDESHSSTLMRADKLLALVKRGVSTLRKLTLEPQNLRPEDTVTCLSLANEVSHLVLKCPSFTFETLEDDTLPSDVFDLDLLTIPDNSCPFASQDILLPKLEILEMNGIRQFTDDGILRLLASRLDAARRGDISPLRHLKLQFARHRQRDIIEEASELAKSAGFELSLKLDYPPDGLSYGGRLSSSFEIPISNSDEEAWPPVIN